MNLFNDGSGTYCRGILVNSWDVYDHTFTATVQRNTQPDHDNANLRDTIAYTGTVHTYILMSGPAVVTINGVVQTERLLRTR